MHVNTSSALIFQLNSVICNVVHVVAVVHFLEAAIDT